jgi:ribosome recycling factor
LRHATIEEIEAEKSVIEDQAVSAMHLLTEWVFCLPFLCLGGSLAADMHLQRERMEKAIETVQNNFNTVRTGRANPAMLDRIEV